MKPHLKTETYYANVEVDGEWARGTVSQVFGVAEVGAPYALLNGWVIDNSHPQGLLLKVLPAGDFARIRGGEELTEFHTGHCFIPWRFVRYIAYLEHQKMPKDADPHAYMVGLGHECVGMKNTVRAMGITAYLKNSGKLKVA